MFCPEHMHYESGRIIRTLNEIGSKLDDPSKGFHIACGIFRRAMKPQPKKKFYQYCPSMEGTLPAWLEMENHLTRWLTACYKVFKHADGNSYRRFPVQIIQEQFPEIVDIDTNQYYHGYCATLESIKAYGLDVNKPWERNVPTLLHQFGAMQLHMPYHDAIDNNKYQTGERFVWETGKQSTTYAKDLFEFSSTENIPKCPALRLRASVDGTNSPSYEQIEDQIPKVMFGLLLL